MKNTIIIGLIIFLLIIAGVATYFIYNNTSLLRISDQSKQVEKNNQSILTSDQVSQGKMQQAELYLINLDAKKLEVDNKFKIGALAETRILNLPKDFNINVYAAGLNAPRFMSFDNDNNLYVADKGRGAIYLIKNNDNDGVSDAQIEVDSGLRVIHSVFFYQGDLYAAEEDKVLRYNDIESDGKYFSKEILVSNLPTDGGHSTRTVIVGPDEKLYVSIGSSCNLCEEKDQRRAALVRYNLDGSGEEIFARGLRNSVGIKFFDGNLWGVNNGRDLLGDDLPPEEVNIIEQGKHYGWPYCYGDGLANPEYSNYTSFCQNETEYPVYQMQAHSAPLGMDFYQKDDSGFAEALKDNLFIGFHGSWNRTVPTGYKVVRIDTTNKDSQTINFITGWLEENGEAWGRPVDVEFNQRGEMFVSDDRAGAIYRVTYQQ